MGFNKGQQVQAACRISVSGVSINKGTIGTITGVSSGWMSNRYTVSFSAPHQNVVLIVLDGVRDKELTDIPTR